MYTFKFSSETSSMWNKNWNYIFLRNTQNYANDLLRVKSIVNLNDVLDFLGMAPSIDGFKYGWLTRSPEDYIDFGLDVRDDLDTDEIILDFNCEKFDDLFRERKN